MRIVATSLLFFISISHSVSAQNGPNAPSVSPEQRKVLSEEKAAEVRSALAEARKRREAVERQNINLWLRWTHAVCIGCDPTPKGLRIVHTYPLRVLQGIPAAEDDMRERRGLRI